MKTKNVMKVSNLPRILISGGTFLIYSIVGLTFSPTKPIISAMARRHASPAPESQQLLSLSRLLEQPKNDDMPVKEFRAMIVADQEKYNALLAQRKLQA
jgi:hypothetical protein